jgi:hypothetical protein
MRSTESLSVQQEMMANEPVLSPATCSESETSSISSEPSLPDVDIVVGPEEESLPFIQILTPDPSLTDQGIDDQHEEVPEHNQLPPTPMSLMSPLEQQHERDEA